MVITVIKESKIILVLSICLILEIVLIVFIFSFFSSPVDSSSGTNVTVQTRLNVSNPAPEVLSVVITNTSSSYANINVTPSPAITRSIYCNGIVRDYNNRSYINNIFAYLFQNTTSEIAANDNNTHYTNGSCYFNTDVYNPSYGDDATGNYTANYSCAFDILYYINPGYWNCSVYVNSTLNMNGTNSTVSGVNQLLAVTLPSTIDYGTVNSTYVSNENWTNVSNAGNVMINLTLQGYATNVGDGNAMNCSQGSVKNISIMYEKYNLTESTGAVTGLSDFESKYINLTSSPVTKRFSLNYRQEDTYDDAINTTYWRIYVPRGAAGTCSGNIIFGATAAAGS